MIFSMIGTAIRALELIRTKGAINALLTWPKFSLAAYSIVSRLKRAGVDPSTIIDVGANVGQFAVASSKLFSEAAIYPIEPDPRLIEELRRNVGPNTAVAVHQTAVGDSVGMSTFYVNCDPQVSSLLPLGSDRIESFPDSKVVEEIKVPVKTLDSIFNGISLQEPIFVKIDVQGYEDRVIAGAEKFLKRVRWVMIEVSFSQLYDGERDFSSIVEMMESHGFYFVRPLNFHMSPRTGDIIEMDALFESGGRR